MSAAANLPLDQLDVITPDSFEENGYPHEAWDRLRRESPIHYFGDSAVPFWAITKHADITAISISGAEVPKLTMVSPISSGEMPRPRAVALAPSTNLWALKASTNKLTMTTKIGRTGSTTEILRVIRRRRRLSHGRENPG